MFTELFFLIGLSIIIFLALLLTLRHWFKQLEEKTQISKDLIDWLKTQTATTEQKINNQMNNFNQRIDKTLTIIGQLQKVIGEFSEIGRGIKDLQQFLSSPKIRGNLGEQVLKELLSQYFPKSSFKLQYQFKSGEKVDAVIITSQGLIPIDSKFPLENFKKYLKEEDEKEKQNFKKLFINDVKNIFK